MSAGSPGKRRSLDRLAAWKRYLGTAAFFVPADGLPQPSGEVSLGSEAEFALGSGCITQPWLAIGQAGIELDLAPKAGDVGDRGGQFTDRDLTPRGNVDRVGTVVELGCPHDRLSGIVDVQELAAGRPIALDNDTIVPRLRASMSLRMRAGIMCRAVRIEVVARP